MVAVMWKLGPAGREHSCPVDSVRCLTPWPFDCNVYLKQCKCRAKTTSFGECMTNTYCNTPGAECCFSSNVADVRDAF